MRSLLLGCVAALALGSVSQAQITPGDREAASIINHPTPKDITFVVFSKEDGHHLSKDSATELKVEMQRCEQVASDTVSPSEKTNMWLVLANTCIINVLADRHSDFRVLYDTPAEMDRLKK